jgi:hypothetical protein
MPRDETVRDENSEAFCNIEERKGSFSRTTGAG